MQKKKRRQKTIKKISEVILFDHKEEPASSKKVWLVKNVALGGLKELPGSSSNKRHL